MSVEWIPIYYINLAQKNLHTDVFALENLFELEKNDGKNINGNINKIDV